MKRLDTRRVNFCPEADTRLRRLKSVTGVTPNLLCRMGFCMSLEEPAIPDPRHYPPGPRDINRYTLTGDFDRLMLVLFQQRMAEDQLPWDQAEEQFAAHMNRGVLLLGARVKAISDLV